MDLRKGAGRFGQDLTPRERFRRVMHYQHVDYISHLEFGYWAELKEQWMAEGHLPASMRNGSGAIPDRAVEEYFGIEQFEGFSARLGAMPVREEVIVQKTDTTVTFRDGLGVLSERQTIGSETIPHFLEFPIRDRASWEAFRDEFYPEYRAGDRRGRVARPGRDDPHHHEPRANRLWLVHRAHPRLGGV